MAGSQVPQPHGNSIVRVNDGTLCRAASPKPGPVCGESTANPRGTCRILGFDGIKVHKALFDVALAETQWQDLTVDPRSAVESPAPSDRAAERAEMLYDMFLDACSKGPAAAAFFLQKQHNLQREYLLKSQAIIESLQAQYARDNARLARLAFAAQSVKSAATATLAIAGVCLAGPEIAVLALGYDVTLELIKRIGSPSDAHANAVVVGFKQTAYNDAAGVAGSVRQERIDTAKAVLKKTLRYPNKSSTYRSAVANASMLDGLLKALGIISAGVTLYSESTEVVTAYAQMQQTASSQ